jgi:hypothetical protein
VISYLNLQNNQKKVSRKRNTTNFNTRIKELLISTQELISYQSVYDIFKASDLPLRSCFEEAERVALAILTIGPDLPEKANSAMNKGEYVDGVIYDAIGSAAVESLADKVNLEINQEATKLSLDFSKRYSPGYCNWDVKDQEIIFDHLPAHLINVSLTESYLMSPIKSVSFAVNFGKDISSTKWENRCKFCDDRDFCLYKMK